MEVFEFVHHDGVKAGCCNYEVTRTYWIAESREEAFEEMRKHTQDGVEEHGNCANCLAQLLAEEEYELKKGVGE